MAVLGSLMSTHSRTSPCCFGFRVTMFGDTHSGGPCYLLNDARCLKLLELGLYFRPQVEGDSLVQLVEQTDLREGALLCL